MKAQQRITFATSSPFLANDSIFNETMMNDIYKTGQDLLLKEAKALTLLSQQLGESDVFNEAVRLIGKTKGRLIVSGVGKSGHVGRKMAATFASTGQPAFFVHAAEAGHGDLGMITPEDTLLLISYSGKAKELQSVLDYAHRFGIPVVSITGREDSLLAQHSTIVLLLPDVPEACPMGLAPTTSTTMTMALGDALAVSLLTLRGFTSSDFTTFHPGGHLGFKLQSIEDFMHKHEGMPILSQNAPVQAALSMISSGKLGCVGLVDDKGTLSGILTDGDVRRFTQKVLNNEFDTASQATLCSKDIMTPSPVTISKNSLLGDALAIFEKKSITHLFVVDEAMIPVGVLHIHDCLRGKAI